HRQAGGQGAYRGLAMDGAEPSATEAHVVGAPLGCVVRATHPDGVADLGAPAVSDPYLLARLDVLESGRPQVPGAEPRRPAGRTVAGTLAPPDVCLRIAVDRTRAVRRTFVPRRFRACAVDLLARARARISEPSARGGKVRPRHYQDSLSEAYDR